MNYIKKLQQENAELKQNLKETEENVLDILAYLSLPKFQGEGNDYVHVSTDIKHQIKYLLKNIKSI